MCVLVCYVCTLCILTLVFGLCMYVYIIEGTKSSTMGKRSNSYNECMQQKTALKCENVPVFLLVWVCVVWSPWCVYIDTN